MSQPFYTRHRPLMFIAALLVILAPILVFFMVNGKESSEASPKPENIPTSLIGEWRQTSGGIDGVLMTASVSPGSIQINMESRDSSSIYWLGTFDTDKNPNTSFKTESIGDSDAMSMSIFGSQDKTKLFSYENGKISYKFTMLKTTTTVYLAKA